MQSSRPYEAGCSSFCVRPYPVRSQVQLTAVPAPRWTFLGFGGSADCSDGRVTLDDDLFCTAEFGPDGSTGAVAILALGPASIALLAAQLGLAGVILLARRNGWRRVAAPKTSL